MTSEAQRLAIAVACPKVFEIHHTWKVDRLRPYLTRKGEGGDGDIVDPLSDLNAMHEAETLLEELDLCIEYVNTLRDCVIAPKTMSRYGLTHATAPQRAMAFLKTIGKWTDT